MRSRWSRVALIQCDWCPHKKGNVDTDRCREIPRGRGEGKGEDLSTSFPSTCGGPGPAPPGSQTSGARLRDNELRLSRPVRAPLPRQSREANPGLPAVVPGFRVIITIFQESHGVALIVSIPTAPEARGSETVPRDHAARQERSGGLEPGDLVFSEALSRSHEARVGNPKCFRENIY